MLILYNGCRAEALICGQLTLKVCRSLNLECSFSSLQQAEGCPCQVQELHERPGEQNKRTGKSTESGAGGI